MAAESLRIAVVVPPWFEVPPAGYGGIEGMSATLIDELVRRGHQVTVFGTGGTGTRAQRFVRVFDEPRSERLARSDHACIYIAHVELSYAACVANLLATVDVDVVHDHSLAGPMLASRRQAPTVVTAHVIESTELPLYYRALGDTIGLVAISDAQRAGAADLPWVGTVHNGIVVGDYPFRREKEDFILFLGRISAEKGPAQAIEAAHAAGRRIVLAGKCDDPDEQAHFDEFIRPRLGPGVEWYGEAGQAAKKDLLARASCLLFPVQWDEPFGLVMVEAMACGTPVVALRRGAVPEVVVDGVTGAVRDDAGELPAAIDAVTALDPADCRRHVETHFDGSTMAARYEQVYRNMLHDPARSDQARHRP